MSEHDEGRGLIPTADIATVAWARATAGGCIVPQLVGLQLIGNE